MTIVHFDEDEWYPVYSVRTDLEDIDAEHCFDINDEVLQRWERVTEAFSTVQDEIGSMLHKREQIRLELMRQERFEKNATEDDVIYDPISGRRFNTIARDNRIQAEYEAVTEQRKMRILELARREALDE